VVLNKCDLPGGTSTAEESAAGLGLDWVRVSAKTGQGLEELCARLRGKLLGGAGEPDPDEAAPNARQAANIRRAGDELAALAAEAEAGLPYDILGLRLDAACRALAEITGEIAPDEVLEAIFSKFCLGK